ncbi:MAG: DNA repair protein RecO [Asticcacaulis sp.]
MIYDDEAFVLSARPHGETGAVVHFLTRDHGHIAAHVAGAASRRLKPYLQPASHVRLSYRARSTDNLGSATLEPMGEGADVLDDPVALLGLQCACVMTRAALPERDPQAGAFEAFSALITSFQWPDIWPYVYVRFEAGLLEAVGFGLDLSACAVTGGHDDLIYVSPKSGRAVSRKSGAPFCNKLLPLPEFLLSAQGARGPKALADGFHLTGFFLERHIFHPLNQPLPEIRSRLLGYLGQTD